MFSSMSNSATLFSSRAFSIPFLLYLWSSEGSFSVSPTLNLISGSVSTVPSALKLGVTPGIALISSVVNLFGL